MSNGVPWLGAVSLAVGATAVAMAEVSGSVSVTVFGVLSAAPVPTSAQMVQTFSTVVMGIVGVWIAVAPGSVQPQ